MIASYLFILEETSFTLCGSNLFVTTATSCKTAFVEPDDSFAFIYFRRNFINIVQHEIENVLWLS